MKKPTFLILLVIFSMYLFAPQPKARAMEPVTIALLAPVALMVAEKARPYIIRGLLNGAKNLIVMGKDVLQLMRFPLGLVQSTVLMPFCFKDGVKNMIIGGIAPIKLIFHAVLLPIQFLGINV
jgi:hypothetical protein